MSTIPARHDSAGGPRRDRPALTARLRSLLVVAVAVPLALVAAGCQSQSNDGGPAEPDDAHTSVTDTGAPTEDGDLEPDPGGGDAASAGDGQVLEISDYVMFKDASGYFYKVEIAASSEDGFSSDPTTSKPGRTDVVGNVDWTVTVTNLTRQRIAPTPRRLTLYLLYPKSSLVCKALKTGKGEQEWWDELPTAGSKTPNFVGDAYCGFVGGDFSAELLKGYIQIDPSTHAAASGAEEVLLPNLKESAVDDAIDAFATPDGAMLLLPDGASNGCSVNAGMDVSLNMIGLNGFADACS